MDLLFILSINILYLISDVTERAENHPIVKIITISIRNYYRGYIIFVRIVSFGVRNTR